ncbi:DeoR/GlpR transcriptional regulator [Priestia megaterium]|nr:DeoR/GlpR transcriptional regulator [Priestia megaterium]
MYQEQRMREIKAYLSSHKNITLEEICKMFTVSKDTARRDLVKLEERGEIIRVKGGATLSSANGSVQNYKERIPTEAKEKIAKAAAGLVRHNYDVLMDTSSTVSLMAKFMTNQQVNVITNSIDMVNLLEQYTYSNIYLLPGKFNGKNRNVVGPRTLATLDEYKVDQLFLGTCGIGDDGITCPDEEETFLKRKMISCARQVILLADRLKFEREFLHKVCDIHDIDIIITDKQPGKQITEQIEAANIQLIVIEADKGEIDNEEN